MTLEFTQGSDDWHRFRKRALTDLYWFCANVLGYSGLFALEAETHLLALRFAERRTGIAALDEAPFQLILWPRDTGKSSCITVGRSLQRICENPNVAILIANEKEETAADFIDSIKNHIATNDFLRALFPEIIPRDFNQVTWAKTRADVNRTTTRPEPTVMCIGVGGTVTGKHFDLIICDDLISREAMENARAGNWTVMHKVNRWVNQLRPLRSKAARPFPQITFIGTRWWNDDVYQHVEEKAYGKKDEQIYYRINAPLPSGRKVSRSVYRTGDLAVMKISVIENGELVFPKIWPEHEIQSTLATDPEFAACNLFNNPSNVAIRTFQDEWLRYWRYSDSRGETIAYIDDRGDPHAVAIKSLYRFITCDPAASRGEEGARNAIVVLGVDQATGKFFILDIIANHDDPQDFVQTVVNTAQRWGVNRVYIELAGQQLYAIQWVENEAQRRNYPMSVEDLKPGGRNKDLRISGLVVPFKNGDVFVHASQTALIVDEYRHYRPGASKRDVLDVLAYAMEVAPKPLGNRLGLNPEQRSRQQLNTYLERRGMR